MISTCSTSNNTLYCVHSHFLFIPKKWFVHLLQLISCIVFFNGFLNEVNFNVFFFRIFSCFCLSLLDQFVLQFNLPFLFVCLFVGSFSDILNIWKSITLIKVRRKMFTYIGSLMKLKKILYSFLWMCVCCCFSLN